MIHLQTQTTVMITKNHIQKRKRKIRKAHIPITQAMNGIEDNILIIKIIKEKDLPHQMIITVAVEKNKIHHRDIIQIKVIAADINRCIIK